MIRAQFWIKYRGRVDVFISRENTLSADALARAAVADALRQFNAKWPAAEREESFCCVGLEDTNTGHQVLVGQMEQAA